jgi:hypothetical protein
MATTARREFVVLAGQVRSRDKSSHNVVFVDEITVAQTESFIAGCQNCAWSPELTFDYVLDAITDSHSAGTDYVLCRPARCRSCGHEVRQKTLVVVI